MKSMWLLYTASAINKPPRFQPVYLSLRLDNNHTLNNRAKYVIDQAGTLSVTFYHHPRKGGQYSGGLYVDFASWIALFG